MTTGFVCHELYFWHNTGNWSLVWPTGLDVQPGEHAENAEPKRRFRNLLEASGVLDQLARIPPRPAQQCELLRVHSQSHLSHLEKLNSVALVDAGDLTPMGRGSYDIAKLAAGGAIAAADTILAGTVSNAYALVRPPGHHAGHEGATGFCLLNNVAIATRHLQTKRSVVKVAIVDWDVHHGNGTQEIFYGDASVLTISLHQENAFPPNSGSVNEKGKDQGLSYNINVPLPPGSGIGAYRHALTEIVVPAIDAFSPDFLIVASGLDACGVDPLGRMLLSAEDYAEMTQILKGSAAKHCDGRVLMVHEGGYSAMYAPYCGLAIVEALAGINSAINDPWFPDIKSWSGHDLQPHQAKMIEKAKVAARDKSALFTN